jgi:hypothetical protein
MQDESMTAAWLLPLAGAMASVLISWLALWLVFVVAGLLVRRVFGLRTCSIEALIASFWMGWAVITTILQIWHLLFRVGWAALLLVTITGTAGLLWNAQDLLAAAGRAFKRRGAWAVCAAALLVAIWLSNRALGPAASRDSGLYYFPTVRWLTAYRIVPGLGNLHGRLAFNSSHFLLAAMLEVGPWTGRSFHLVNGLLLLALLLEILAGGFTLVANRSRVRLYHLFYLLLAAPVLRHATGPNVSTPSTDTPVFILMIVVAARFLAFLEETFGQHGTNQSESSYRLLLVAVLAAAGTTVKLNFAVFGGLTALVMLMVWIAADGKKDTRTLLRTAAWIGAAVALILVPWIARSVILSGYVAYPIPTGAVSVAWRVPHAQVVYEARLIRSHARGERVRWPGAPYSWDWLSPWAAEKLRSDTYELVIPLALTIALLSTLLLRPRAVYKRAGLWLFVVPTALFLVFWFFAAPEPRFAGSGFWVLAVGTAALALDRWELERVTLSRLALAIAVAHVALGVGPPAFESLYGPGEDGGFHPAPQADVIPYVTPSGLIVFTPVSGDQCWNAPLPCTPYRDIGLRLRDENDMQRGFIPD